MADLKKPINKKGYTEIVVDKELFNIPAQYADGVLMETETQARWATLLDNVSEKAKSVYLGRDLSAEDRVEIDNVEQLSRNKANGYYKSVIYPLNPNINIPKKQYGVAGALVGSNPKYDRVLLPCCYAYDINSSYLSALADGMFPYIDGGDLGSGWVEEGQIGFITKWGLDSSDNKEKNVIIDYTFSGFAHHRFIYKFSQNLQNWAKTQYARIKQADKEEGKVEKLAFVKMTGVIRNHNPWMYEYIVRKSAKRIEEILDEDTILWNTDGFISLTKREDIPIGLDLGQFKVEFSECPVRCNGTNYAWKDNKGYHSKVRGDTMGEQEEVEYSAREFLEHGKILPRSMPKYKVIKVRNQGVSVI